MLTYMSPKGKIQKGTMLLMATFFVSYIM